LKVGTLGCGLRLGEALSLKRADAEACRRGVLLVNGKGGRLFTRRLQRRQEQRFCCSPCRAAFYAACRAWAAQAVFDGGDMPDHFLPKSPEMFASVTIMALLGEVRTTVLRNGGVHLACCR
jgi:hypothetical protein